MRNILWALLTLASTVIILMVPTVASASDPAGDRVIDTREARVAVRTYRGGLVSDRDCVSALSVAGGILKTAGLDVHWRICDDGAGQMSPDPCAEPLGSNELTVRFLRRPLSMNRAGQVPLGTSLIDRQAGSGTLATIYIDRVASLARDSRTKADILLGRAIAHEIGHLLLGTTGHSRTGLMRAVWSTPELRRHNADDWVFSPSDARSMRDVLFLDQH